MPNLAESERQSVPYSPFNWSRSLTKHRAEQYDLESQNRPLIAHNDGSTNAMEPGRNVEDNIQAPTFGYNYDDSTPWHQHDNPTIRLPARFMRWLLHGGLLTAILNWPEYLMRFFQVVVIWTPRILSVPIAFPIPFFLIVFCVTNMFFILALTRGEFPILLFLVDAFLMVFLGIMGRCDCATLMGRSEHFG